MAAIPDSSSLVGPAVLRAPTAVWVLSCAYVYLLLRASSAYAVSNVTAGDKLALRQVSCTGRSTSAGSGFIAEEDAVGISVNRI